MSSFVGFVGQRFVRQGIPLALCFSALACGAERAAPTPAEPLAELQQPSLVAPGFQENQLLSGHVNPVGIRFVKAPGPLRAVVFEKSGKVYYYDDLSIQATPAQAKLVADLSGNTHDFWDRGLLGLAIDPGFPAKPDLYVLTTFDPGNFWSDACADPTGAGCVVNGRLSRLKLDIASPSVASTVEEPLLDARWCNQYPSHATGDLQFGADGFLYASSGDGASFNFLDWGNIDGLLQGVLTKNVCNDPGGLDANGRLLLATSEGGQLRSQDLQSGADATGYNGTILRMDVSGALPVAPASNPLVGKGPTTDDFIIATGLRNPYRFNIRPGTNEVWIADVGEGQIEEINRISDPSGTLENFGWPCFEGSLSRFSGNALCDQIKAGTFAGAVSPQALVQPYFSYRHDQLVAPGDGCGTGGSSITGVAFNDKNTYPASLAGALFFADSTRKCVWSMRQGAGGQPDPATRAVLVQGAAGRVVDLQMAGDGRLYYVDFDRGRVYRIDNFVGNQPPQAAVSATPSSGPAPLTVQLTAAQSTDAEGGPLSYAWDLDNDGIYGDAQGVAPQITFSTPGNVTVSVLATDDANNSDTASVVINVGNSPPEPHIDAPLVPSSWAAGDTVIFAGSAVDAEDGALAEPSLSWQLVLKHCASEPVAGQPEDCHEHVVQSFAGASGSFTAPDHTYYSYLQLKLTATDSQGLSTTTVARLEPLPVTLSVSSVPPGIVVNMGEHPPQVTPIVASKVLKNGQTTVQVESPQSIGGRSYEFESWSNGGARVQTLQPASDQVLTVTFKDVGPAATCKDLPLPVVASAASSSEGVDTPAAEAFDGINTAACGAGGNRWSSQFADPQWLYADLGADRRLSSATLHWECAFSSDFDLQVAPDGADPTSSSAYTTIFSNRASTGGSQVIPGLNANGRYVRIYSRKRATAWGNSLFEVEVRGDTNPGCSSGGPVCGNGQVEAGEACDDGNTIDTDGCSSACRLPACGDAICSASETCSACASDCGACPGRSIAANLEAEANDGMLGLQLEATADTGGGQNAGWIDTGDWVQWTIAVPMTGQYSLTARSASWTTASFQVLIDGAAVTSLSYPSTWPGSGAQFQTWRGVTTSSFNLTAGVHTLRVQFTSGAQNLNFVKVSEATSLLVNGAFSTDRSSWLSFFQSPGAALWETGAVKVTPGSSGTDWWAQLFQSRTVAAGSYRLTANAQTISGTKTIALFCEQDGGAFTSYGQANCNISTAWNSGVGCSVTCNNVPANTPVKFGVKGGLTNSAFRVDNFVLTKL